MGDQISRLEGCGKAALLPITYLSFMVIVWLPSESSRVEVVDEDHSLMYLRVV